MHRLLRSRWGGLWLLLAWTAATSMFAAEPRVDRSPGSPDSPGLAVSWWRSSEDLHDQLSPQPPLRFERGSRSSRGFIEVDDRVTYQSMLGLGSSLEHSTRYNLSLLPAERREPGR